MPAADAPAYRDDVAFLREHTPLIELKNADARIAVAPALQGRVMTSGVSAEGLSLGWVNRDAVTAGDQDIAFNNYGGAERFWLAPEGGQFTLFHRKGDPQNYDTWKVPDAFNKGAFEVVHADASSVTMRREMDLTNAEATRFQLRVDRTIRVVTRSEAEQVLNLRLSSDVLDVGYLSDNRITNTGTTAWEPQTGTIAIWILGMFRGRDQTVVIAPLADRGTEPVINMAYYPDQPDDRIVIDRAAHTLLFRADGDCRSKFGLTAGWARDRLGSIDLANRVLTIVLFRRPPEPARYVNCLMQQRQDDPYAGDVINSYNHFGGLRFYELESASPAAFLKPGGSLDHMRYTLQFHGPLERLSEISRKVFGIGLERVRQKLPGLAGAMSESVPGRSANE